MGGACGMYGGEETFTFFGGKLEERDHLGNLGISGNIILEQILKKYSGKGWIGLVWFSTHKSGGHL